MPALFERHTHTPARRHHRRTVIASAVLHAAALLVLIVAQLGAAFDGLAVNQRLQMVTIPAPPPPPPAVQAPRPVPRQAATANPQAAPVEANDIVLDVPPAPAVSGPVVPGALAVGGEGAALGAVSDGAGSVALTPAPQAPADPVRPGGDILAPTRTHFVSPAYPEVARAARIDGTVILEAVIDETGRVRDVRVLRSIPLLDRAAMEAVRQWRYTPTRLNGVPVAVVMTVTVTFTLR